MLKRTWAQYSVTLLNLVQFPDCQGGEWFGYLTQEGKVALDFKGGPFKGETSAATQQMQQIFDSCQSVPEFEVCMKLLRMTIQDQLLPEPLFLLRPRRVSVELKCLYYQTHSEMLFSYCLYH